jgi:hypothetical protein
VQRPLNGLGRQLPGHNLRLMSGDPFAPEREYDLGQLFVDQFCDPISVLVDHFRVVVPPQALYRSCQSL